MGSEAAHKVETQSSRMLKAKLKPDPRPTNYIQALQKLMNAARVHDVEAKSERWVEDLCKLNAPVNWTHIKTKLPALYKAKVFAGAPPTEPAEDASIAIKELIFTESKLTDQQTYKLFQNLDDDRLSDIFAAAPRDYIVMTYVDQGRDIEFPKASRTIGLRAS